MESSESSHTSSSPYINYDYQLEKMSTDGDSFTDKVKDFFENSRRGGLLFSKRAWIIYSLFFAPPFILTLGWLFIPLTHYSTYSVAISIYYCAAFIAWINFNNIVMPGCPVWLMVISFISFAAPLGGYLAYANNSHIKNEKLSYAVIHAFTFATTSLCYLGYVIRHKVLKARQENYRMKEEARDREKGELPSFFAYKLCFVPTIDDPEVHKWVSYRGSYEEKINKAVTFKNLAVIVLYQLVVVGAWVWLQAFADLVLFRKVFSSTFEAIAATVIFQVSKMLLIALCSFANSLLPPTPYDSVAHFTLFQLQISFLLYYRTLFMSFSGWPQTILVSVVTLVFDIFYYPVRMMFTIWNFRYVTLKIKAEIREWDRKYPAIFNFLFLEASTYEESTNVTCIEYYYEKIAEYYSLISTVIFISILRHVSYHKNAYTTFSQMSSHTYGLLLWRYFYLFVFETTTDISLRLFVKKKMDIDISNKGRNYTIANYITRFLFATFFVYDLITVYYSQIDVDFN